MIVQHLAAVVDDDLGHGLHMVGTAAIVHETGIGDMVALRGNEVQGAARLTVSAVLHIDFSEGRWLNEWARYASFKNDQSVARTWVENSRPQVICPP